MTTTTTDLELTVTRHVNAPPERVFDAWLDPARLADFMRPMREMPAPEVSNDPRKGGRFDILMKAGDQEIPHWGEYLELDRPHRLVFSWNSPFSVEGSTVTLTFAAGGGGTDVTLHHVRFPSDESRENHEKGWGLILETLAGVAGG